MFDLMFTHCPAKGSPPAMAGGPPAPASFTLDYTFFNPGPNYLSAGEVRDGQLRRGAHLAARAHTTFRPALPSLTRRRCRCPRCTAC